MSRAGTLVLLGIIVAVAPFLGLPFYILSWVYPILGIMIVLTGLSLRLRRPREEPNVEATPPHSFDIHEPQRPQI